MGLVPYVTFVELENWAMSLDNRAPPAIAAVSTDVCFRCKRTGHRKAQCPLSFRRPWGPGPKGASHLHSRTPRAPTTRNAPDKGSTATPAPTNPAAQAQNPLPPTGVNSVGTSCSSFYSCSPDAKTE
ncbi:hypothetical protein chiPu_0022996 [Chiloscyllium punctatum]|uniref:CCHC-type domain-containing protein n=1 Tax=Chiloscyllium punctatum TaxID=137246 RepID=A0A401T8D3_CHIPU|nr:hypothetical protein [Chiloscyllium punctatum]